MRYRMIQIDKCTLSVSCELDRGPQTMLCKILLLVVSVRALCLNVHDNITTKHLITLILTEIRFAYVAEIF